MIKQFPQTIWHTIIRILAFISKEIRAILHQPRLIFSLILGPFFILLIFGIGYREESRTLKTLFVVSEGSAIEEDLNAYATSLGDIIEYAGTTHDAELADSQLRAGEVDLVVVAPLDPTADWENDETSKFTLYHAEVDPYEQVYIRVLGQRYIEEINKQVLMTALEQSQQEATQWQGEVDEAKTHATNVRQALDAGDDDSAISAAQSLKANLDVLSVALGTGTVMLAELEGATNQPSVATELQSELVTLQSDVDTILETSGDESALVEGQETAVAIESSLENVDQLLVQFQEMDTSVLVAPFESQLLSITQMQIQPMHFYVPAVIALLLQHIAITLAGLSIIREKTRGVMELLRVAPISAFEILFGKYISYMILIGMLAAVLTGLIIFGLRVPQLGLWLNYVLVIVALLLASLGIGFNISLSARSDSQAIQYGMLTLLSAIFFSGFFIPLYRLILPVRVISWLLPATYGTVLLQDVMLKGQPPQALMILSLFLFTAVLFLVAWFRLGRQMKKE